MNRYQLEEQLWKEGHQRVMGLDEVGRGCLCGPVVAAGVIIDPQSRLSDRIMDSKKLSKTEREELALQIKEHSLFWAVRNCSPEEIDQINILKASIRAMLKCVETPGADADYLLVDGNRFTSVMTPYSCIVKGDDRSASIAAASVIAKVERDRMMAELHKKYPFYGWDRNVGYPTKEHYSSLEKHGYTKHHRKSFKLRTDVLCEVDRSAIDAE
ncbi:MAG: ribonuclease HII [Balneolaceae bacterium]|nr:ribonuclease HII [Balneolaceae bacterium]